MSQCRRSTTRLGIVDVLLEHVDDAQVWVAWCPLWITLPGGQSGRPSSRAPSTSPFVVTNWKCGTQSPPP